MRDFYQALLIRNRKGNLELSDSTLFAIEATKRKLCPQIDEAKQSDLISRLKGITFIQEFIGVENKGKNLRTNCINAVLNCFVPSRYYTFEPFEPLKFIEHLKEKFVQMPVDSPMSTGDLIVFWTRLKDGVWDKKRIVIENIKPEESDFPYGIIFDHVAYVVDENIVFHKPNPSILSTYKFDYLETAMLPAKLSHGFEFTLHRKAK